MQAVSQLNALIETLELLVAQARAYERALPANNYPARAVVLTLSELGKRALKEACDLATFQPSPDPGINPLSTREQEVLRLAARGLTNKAIAYRLGISERTIQFHMNSIFNKTDTQSRTAAVTYAMKNNWIEV